MTLVVDASVALKWHLRDEGGLEAADAMLHQLQSGQLDVLAPHHLRIEMAAALLKATRRQPPRLSPAEARSALTAFLALGIRYFDSPLLTSLAYDLAGTMRCSAYDALYLALAQTADARVVTADEPFYNAVAATGAAVWLGEYIDAT